MNKTRLLLKAFLVGALAAASCAPFSALGNDFPVRTLRIVVPFGPGGITDLIARQMAKGMSEKLGQSVIVENKPGAGHVISLQTLAQAQPDGYTILLGSNTGFTVTPHLYKNLGFDVATFKPIAPINTAPTVLAARPDFPANNLSELVRLTKSKPGSMNYGSFGIGSSAHLGMEIFKRDMGIEITHVPYKGDAPVFTALLAKEVDVAFITLFSAQARIRTGEIKALGLLQAERIPTHPGIQTTVEAGSANSDLPVWIAFFAHPATPDDIMKKLETVTRSIVSSAEFRDFLRSRGAEPLEIDNVRFMQFIRTQSARIGPIVDAIGLKAQ